MQLLQDLTTLRDFLKLVGNYLYFWVTRLWFCINHIKNNWWTTHSEGINHIKNNWWTTHSEGLDLFRLITLVNRISTAAKEWALPAGNWSLRPPEILWSSWVRGNIRAPVNRRRLPDRYPDYKLMMSSGMTNGTCRHLDTSERGMARCDWMTGWLGRCDWTTGCRQIDPVPKVLRCLISSRWVWSAERRKDSS